MYAILLRSVAFVMSTSLVNAQISFLRGCNDFEPCGQFLVFNSFPVCTSDNRELCPIIPRLLLASGADCGPCGTMLEMDYSIYYQFEDGPTEAIPFTQERDLTELHDEFISDFVVGGTGVPSDYFRHFSVILSDETDDEVETGSDAELKVRWRTTVYVRNATEIDVGDEADDWENFIEDTCDNFFKDEYIAALKSEIPEIFDSTGAPLTDIDT